MGNNMKAYLPIARLSFIVQLSISSCSTSGIPENSLKTFSDLDRATSASASLLITTTTTTTIIIIILLLLF